MTSYRRVKIPGGTYFFTLALADRGATTLVDNIQALRDAFRGTLRERPFHTDALVVLPDHLHAIWTLPAGDADYSTRWGAIKSRFTREVTGRMGFNPILRSPSKIKKGDAGIWQRRFWEHTIRGEADYRLHLRYCWGDPVQHGLVERAVDWAYSSLHRDIRAGQVDPGWAGGMVDGAFGECGERTRPHPHPLRRAPG